MNSTGLPDLHDGFFDGLWLSEDKRVRLFVRTEAGEPFTIILTEVEALNVNDLRAGNIIFDVTLIAPENLTLNDIEQVYDLTDNQSEMARRLLIKTQHQILSPVRGGWPSLFQWICGSRFQ